MDGGSFTLRWDEDPRVQSGGVVSEEVICGMETVQNQHYASMDSHSSHLGGDSIIADTDQIAAENLIFLAQDMVGNYGEPMQYRSDSFTVEHVEIDNDEVECQITEEVITDDWVQPCGQERVEVPLDQMTMAVIEQQTEENDIDVPLPTDQDEYTAMRPYPCDFCSRRFRKKANLVNHMVAHQNDRPFGCNLCGARYVRRNDLLNHLKVHAYVPDDGDEDSFLPEAPKRKPGRRRSPQSSENGGSFSYSTENETTQVAARTQLYGGSGSTATGSNSNAHQATIRVKFEATDPRRPFVCQHCGVGFAREKALASHSRIHGDDSPIECNVCGELCWSREQLAAHCRSKHPHRPPQISSPQLNGNDDTLSDSSVNDNLFDVRGPELTCRDCGAGFQRADLLRRHIRAAHSYKLEPPDMVDKHDNENDNMEDHTDMDSDPWGNAEHNCSVCGEGFRDALELLAHAESHARSRNNRCMQCGEQFEDEASVADHVTRVHGPILSHVCALCGRICRDRRALLKHSAAQHDAQSHTLFCSKCGKSFHNKARLKRHMASHRDKAVTCNVCGEQFSDGRSLMNHRHSHSGTPARQFPCRECGKTFGSRSSQQIHIRIHTGERPYACRFCWKAFADGGTLRKHERIHTGEKPYACAVCPRAFNQRVVLREHVRSHHSAPDARRGTGASPFWCAVCSRLLHTSSDLVQHLIQHCDANTAMKRQPQVGPRKYKRRRKLKPHELVDLSNRPDKDDSDRSEPEMEEVIRPPPPVKRRTPQTKKAKKAKGRAPPLEMESLMDVSPPAVSVTFDATAGGSARTKGKSKGKRGNGDPPARPKMIHTQKIKDGDGPVKRRGRGPAAATLVTPCAPTPAPAPQTEDRIRPRTKNVRYHEPGRPPPATFPASVKPEPETDIAADLRAIQRAPQSTPSRREKIKREPHVTSSTARLDDLHDSSLAIKAELDDVIASASIQAAEGGPFRCEMCSQAFPLHEQLLLHVPVHI